MACERIDLRPWHWGLPGSDSGLLLDDDDEPHNVLTEVWISMKGQPVVAWDDVMPPELTELVLEKALEEGEKEERLPQVMVTLMGVCTSWRNACLTRFVGTYVRMVNDHLQDKAIESTIVRIAMMAIDKDLDMLRAHTKELERVNEELRDKCSQLETQLLLRDLANKGYISEADISCAMSGRSNNNGF